MPRSARLDAPGVLHHVIGRGIEKGPIFLTDEDLTISFPDLVFSLRKAVLRSTPDPFAQPLSSSLQDGKDAFSPKHETSTDGICGKI